MDQVVRSLHRDGHRLEALRGAVLQHAAASDRKGTEAAFNALARRLRRRIRLEEELLFPAIEAFVRDPAFETTAKMRREHLVVLSILTGIERHLASSDWAAVSGDLRELGAALHTHLEAERLLLHPLIGRLGPNEALAAAFADDSDRAA
jgi:iron-sulfur cluster repair protein YtfE (RIC family)